MLGTSNCAAKAIDFLNESQLGSLPTGMFIDQTDRIYLLVNDLKQIQIWSDVDVTQIRTISLSSDQSWSIFVTSNQDIYLDVNDGENYRIDRISLNSNSTLSVLFATDRCFAIFVDVDENVYCSMNQSHQVIKRSSCADANSTTLVAGNGTSGSEANMLSHPLGIFVTVQSVLYVADCGNDRIQSFEANATIGRTVMDKNSSSSIALHCPAGLIIDGDGNLFIIETFRHRIIRLGRDSAISVVGSAEPDDGAARSQLHYPNSLSFDSFGHLFVVHHGEKRIFKYLMNDSCGKFDAAVHR